MKPFLKPLLLCATLLAVSATASAQSLWRGVPTGATPAEVVARLPEAMPAPPGIRDSGLQGEALLHIPAHTLVDTEFEVLFGFEQGRLQNIVLRRQAASPVQARELAQRLTTALRASYGLEASTKSRSGTPADGIDRLWSPRRLSVQLQLLDGNLVHLRYSPNLPGTANRPL